MGGDGLHRVAFYTFWSEARSQTPPVVIFALEAGAAEPPAALFGAGAELTWPQADQLPQDPVESLLDDDRNDVEKGIDTAYSH